MGVIEPSTNAWSSPIVLVAKEDGTIRVCVAYRKFNSVTVNDAYPLPRIYECLVALSAAKWFGCIDLSSGFWQLRMTDSDKEKTAFSISQGLY
jgi:aspartate/tyrosine/aromatic aminotransferase